MSFFDSKQEVIKIELTQFGKLLLSRGKFDPKYYAFYDDDVLYDTQYINFEESQNDSQNRILNETPSLKPQTCFSSLENSSRKLSQIISMNNQKSYLSMENNANLSNLLPLGNSELGNKYCPAISLDVLNAKIDTIKINGSDDSGNSLSKFLRIPQINLKELFYKVRAEKSSEEFSILSENQEIIGSVTLNSGEQMNVIGNNEETFSFYSFLEKNSINVNDNFQLEIFVENEEDLNGEKIKVWQQLMFNKKIKSVQNNILTDDISFTDVLITPDNAEWYFELSFDDDTLDYKNRNIKRGLVYGAISDVASTRDSRMVPGVSINAITKRRAENMYSSDITNDDKPFGEDC